MSGRGARLSWAARARTLSSRRVRPQPSRLPRAFSHPAWWAALGLLALNDHVLKGSGMVPGALTGKLSDFAGIVVAPALLAAGLGAGHPTRRWLASAVAGALLAAIKLSPAAAASVAGVLQVLGLPSRIWVDPSDLWALAALPLGHVLSRPRTMRSPRPGVPPPEALAPLRVRLRWVERAGVALASVACMATAGTGEKKKSVRSDAPEVENASEETVVVVLASTEGRGGCKLYRSDRLGALTPDAFGDPRLLMLKPGERALLAVSEEHDPLDCGAASIRLPDGEQSFVAWRDLASIDGYVPNDDGERRARRVLIDGLRGRYEIELGKDLVAFEPGVDAPEPSCPDLPTDPSLEFSPLPEAQGFLEVKSVAEADDGCLTVEWFQLEGDIAAATQRLCIPSWGFPFEVGESLAVTQGRDEVQGTVLQVARLDDGELATQLTLWNGATEAVGDRVTDVEAVDCVGTNTNCGAYLRPLQLSVKKQDQPLVSGDEAMLVGKGNATQRLLVGAAQDVGWAGAECTGDEAVEGPHYNLLELRTF